jgi:hypothetical protein
MIDYDFIMDGDWSHRIRIFNELTPDEKAELLRVHRRRWLAANQHRLSQHQVAAIAEDIAFVSAALYARPRDASLEAQAKQLEQRAISLFERHDLYDLTLHGHRVPDDATRGLGE